MRQVVVLLTLLRPSFQCLILGVGVCLCLKLHLTSFPPPPTDTTSSLVPAVPPSPLHSTFSFYHRRSIVSAPRTAHRQGNFPIIFCTDSIQLILSSSPHPAPHRRQKNANILHPSSSRRPRQETLFNFPFFSFSFNLHTHTRARAPHTHTHTESPHHVPREPSNS